MISKPNEIYSDQYQTEKDVIESVRQLDENEKFKNDTVNSLEELLAKSRRLNNSKCVRLIDQQLKNLCIDKQQRIQNLVLACNQIGMSNEFDWKQVPNRVNSLDLSGNFLSSLNGIEKEHHNLESLALSFNEINQFWDVFTNMNWPHLCLLDLSYNLLDDITKTVQSLKNLPKLRILYLHGNPISLLVDYRIYIVDSLEKLSVLDDTTITAEERYRARTYSSCDRKDRNHARFQISFGSVENVPMPVPSQTEWPLQVHRYKMRLDWFDGENQSITVPFDKMANFKRYNPANLESSYAEYKASIEFVPNVVNLTINTLVPFRDLLFHGVTCRFIDHLTEYWSPEQVNTGNEQKNKSNSSKDKKDESPLKKKKNEDLSKLVVRNDPIETTLAEFHVPLRSFLDGDYQTSFEYKAVVEQPSPPTDQANIQNKSEKGADKSPSAKDRKKTSASKANQGKAKDQQKDKKQANKNDNENESIPAPPPLQCSIHFQLQRFVSPQQIL